MSRVTRPGSPSGSAFGAAFGTPSGGRPSASCPCGSGRLYAGCCGLIHDGVRPARTAEALMRSRYSAYALRLPDYLLASWHPETRPLAMHLEPGQEWLGLEILGTTRGGPGDTTGTVTFRARSRSRGGRESVMTERSRFERYDRAWMYIDDIVSR